MINASYALNNEVHNTSWIPGHFHTTVGGLVFLGILGMSLYLLSQVTGKKIQKKEFAVMVPYLWFVGVLTLSLGLAWGGVLGEPRRTNLGLTYLDPSNEAFRPEWINTTTLTLIGGIIMTTAAALYFYVFYKTVAAPKTEEVIISFPELETIHEEKPISIFQSYKPWIVIMLVAIVLVYGPALMDASKNQGQGAPRFRPNNPTPEIATTSAINNEK